jgi:hypothetical chaperone protein
MRAARPALGIDFGTSNSAVASVGTDGVARLVPLEGGALALPSAVFFNAEDRKTYFGREAVTLYLAGVDGRLMRSLKSLLGSSLLQERTAVAEGLISFQDVISRFIRELRLRAERHLGYAPADVVIGRPVHFVDDSPQRDEQAQSALRIAALASGFENVSFELEPIAAAFDYETRVTRESLVLIVDIGGGTSDFTVVRVGPQRIGRPNRKDDILATSGTHIGGTDYDRKLSLELVMPLLGYRHSGPKGREVPHPVFFDLSTWHLINWLYTPKALRDAQDLRTNYTDTRLHDRLMTVLREKLGHQLASEVEQSKISASVSGGTSTIDLSAVERGLGAALGADDLSAHLQGLLEKVVECAGECVRLAGIRPADLDAIYLTGGSSALRPFQDALRKGFPTTPIVEGDFFGGVASGLGYVAQRL